MQNLPPTLSAETIAEIIDLAADLEHIKAHSVSGVSSHDLRHMATQLRSVSEGDLDRLWRAAGFRTPFKVTASYIDKKVGSDKLVIIGGGEDHDPAHVIEPIVNPTEEEKSQFIEAVSKARRGYSPSPLCIIGITDDGSEIYMPFSQNVSFHVESNSLLPFDSSPEGLGIVTGSMSLGRYFESFVISHYGDRISRYDIVRNVAVARRGVHYKENLPKEGKQKANRAILQKMSSSGIQFRDTVFYIFLSIAQDIVNSPDAHRFCSFAAELEAGRTTRIIE
jgi:hypothetical protein